MKKSVFIMFWICKTAINFTEGRAHIDVYLEGSPDRLFSMDQEIACDDFSKKIPLLECPVKEGSMKFLTFFYLL